MDFIETGSCLAFYHCNGCGKDITGDHLTKVMSTDSLPHLYHADCGSDDLFLIDEAEP